MWNERFSEPGYAYGTEPNDFLVSVAAQIPKGPILSLGEGEGRNAVYLASRGYEVVAVDGSSVGLEKAQGLAKQRGVTLSTHLEDLATFEFESSRFSAIVSIFCHLPPEIRKRVHREVPRALAPGGVFILEGYTPDQRQYGTGGPSREDLLYRVDELRTELRGLEFSVAQEIVRDVREGRYHFGPSAVLQILAFRPATPKESF